MRTLLSLLIVVLLVSGCNHIERATNNITPSGLGDSYTVTYGDGRYAEARTIVYKAANQYCEKKGKKLSIQKESKQMVLGGFGGSNVELVFQCIQRDDQEFQK